MRPVAEEGIISLPEYNEAISQLTSLAEHGVPKAVVTPKLLDQREVAEMLNISHSNFKKLEHQPQQFQKTRSRGCFPIQKENGRLSSAIPQYRCSELHQFL